MNDLLEQLHAVAPRPNPDFARQLEDRLIAELAQMRNSMEGESELIAQTTFTKVRKPHLRRVLASPLMLAAALLIVVAAAWLFGPQSIPGKGQLAQGPARPALVSYPTITPDNASRLQLVDTLGNGAVYEAVYSPDGETLALAGTLGIWLYDADNLQGQSRLIMTDSPVMRIAYSPDGHLIASGHLNGEIRLWSATSGQYLRTLEGHTNRVNALAFSPDGAQLASASGGNARRDNTFRLWDVTTGTELWADRQFTLPGWSVAFSDDKRSLAFDNGNSIILRFDYDSDDPWFQTIERTPPLPARSDILFLSGSDTLVINEGEGIHFYTYDRRAERPRILDDGSLRVGTEANDRLTDIAADAEGAHIVAGTTSGGLYIVDVAEREVTTLREPDGAQVLSVAVSSAEQIAIALNTGEVDTYDLTSGEATGQITAFDFAVTKVMAYGDNELAAMGIGSQFRQWNLNEGTLRDTFNLQTLSNYNADISESGRILAYTGANSGTPQVTVIRNIQEGAETTIDHALTTNLDLSSDGGLLAGVSNDNTVHIIDIHDNNRDVAVKGLLQERFLSVAINPDGEKLAIGRTGGIEVFDVATATMDAILDPDYNSVSVFRLWYSPSGSQLLAIVQPSDGQQVATEGTSLFLLDGKTGELVHDLTLPNPEGGAEVYRTVEADFSPDGGLVVALTSLSSGGTRVDVWDAATGERLEMPGLDRSDISSVAFNTDGNLLITGGWDGLIRLYAVQS